MAEKKMYFDEMECQRLVIIYHKSMVIQNKIVIAKDERVEKEIMEMVRKIVIAIINNYRYYIFEEYEDLVQEGLKACFIGLPRYNAEKGSLFNYMSLIAKIHLLNYTDRRKKHRNHLDIEEQLEVEGAEEMNFDLFLDNLKITLTNIIDENYYRVKRKKYLKITLIIIDYLEKSKKMINKSDLYSWARSYGLKSVNVREYIKQVGAHLPDIQGLL